jgi:hypothetical protein
LRSVFFRVFRLIICLCRDVHCWVQHLCRADVSVAVFQKRPRDAL